MARPWVKPEHTRLEVIDAGERFRDPHSRPGPSDYLVLDNWRAAHAFPLNSVAMTLNGKAKAISDQADVWRRLKRFPSIVSKLRRIRRLTLWEIQDIGGARVIFEDCTDVDRLLAAYDGKAMHAARFSCRLNHVDNYIEHPKKDGYRSAHVIIDYQGRLQTTQAWNGLRIEIQIRSRMQHLWSTTVETLESILSQRLRTFQGDERWKKFLRLVSSAIALKEGRQAVPGTPASIDEIRGEVVQVERELDAKNKLRNYVTAIRLVEEGPRTPSYYYLIDMRPNENKTSVRAFRRDQLKQATRAYAEIEAANRQEAMRESGANAVLVSGSRLADLREAYPNYFLDTGNFLALYDSLITGASPSISPEKTST